MSVNMSSITEEKSFKQKKPLGNLSFSMNVDTESAPTIYQVIKKERNAITGLDKNSMVWVNKKRMLRLVQSYKKRGDIFPQKKIV